MHDFRKLLSPHRRHCRHRPVAVDIIHVLHVCCAAFDAFATCNHSCTLLVCYTQRGTVGTVSAHSPLWWQCFTESLYFIPTYSIVYPILYVVVGMCVYPSRSSIYFYVLKRFGRKHNDFSWLSSGDFQFSGFFLFICVYPLVLVDCSSLFGHSYT